jgi:pyridoxal phosphate enzyme (YggS family)
MNESNYRSLIEELNHHEALLVAVSKVHPKEKIEEAYAWGHRDFGENRAREMQGKQEVLPNDIRWHMIGPLQSNKVKYITDYVYMVHSVDRKKILKEINKRARKAQRTIKVLLQVHIAEEEQKFGFDEKELIQLLEKKPDEQYQNVEICGLMGMATFTDDKEKIRNEFRGLKHLYEKVKSRFELGSSFEELSMGMTGDYKVALDEGATMVRIGSKVFGPRPTKN